VGRNTHHHPLFTFNHASITGSGARETPIQPIRMRYEEALRGPPRRTDHTTFNLFDVADVVRIEHIISSHSDCAGRFNQQQSEQWRWGLRHWWRHPRAERHRRRRRVWPAHGEQQHYVHQHFSQQLFHGWRRIATHAQPSATADWSPAAHQNIFTQNVIEKSHQSLKMQCCSEFQVAAIQMMLLPKRAALM